MVHSPLGDQLTDGRPSIEVPGHLFSFSDTLNACRMEVFITTPTE